MFMQLIPYAAAEYLRQPIHKHLVLDGGRRYISRRPFLNTGSIIQPAEPSAGKQSPSLERAA